VSADVTWSLSFSSTALMIRCEIEDPGVELMASGAAPDGEHSYSRDLRRW